MSELVWIREETVLAIHDRQLAEHGGGTGLRHARLLASALARPQNLLAYGADPPPDLPALAAAYAYGIATNHPFVDGNKRTAYVVCRTFLLVNGKDLNTDPTSKYITFLRLASGEVSEEALATWIRGRMKSLG